MIELAKLRPLQYGKVRKEEAQRLGVPVVTLDNAVRETKKESKEQQNFLPHWTVEPWPDPVDGDELLLDLRKYFSRYIVLPDKAEIALALWALHTWVFDCFDITPYLVISSPTRRCGKTLLMTLLYWLCCRAKKNDSMSKAAIYRSVDRDKPTLLLDEVSWVVDLRDERQNILCGGFERLGHAETCEGEGANIATRLWSTYCPKAFGLIGKLTATLMDRGIDISMQRKRAEKVERLRRRDNDEHVKFRRRCSTDNREALDKATPELPAALHDRAVDYWEPLLAIAQYVGGEWPKLAADAAITLSGGESVTEEKAIELLADFKALFDSGITEITTKALLKALCDDEEKSWATYNKGKQISAKQIGALLGRFPIVSETLHPPGENDAKGYKCDKFADAFERYLTPAKDAQKGSTPESGGSLPSCRPNADGMGTSSNFCKRPESNPDGREKSDFSYSPSDLDVRTGEKSQTSDRGHFEAPDPVFLTEEELVNAAPSGVIARERVRDLRRARGPAGAGARTTHRPSTDQRDQAPSNQVGADR